ncbi:MAG: hypothetical protein AAFY26_23590 [Cyanobacteria bacterium J06638_22]
MPSTSRKLLKVVPQAASAWFNASLLGGLLELLSSTGAAELLGTNADGEQGLNGVDITNTYMD